MKKLLFILIVCCSLNGFGQANDTLKLYWINGNIKCLQFIAILQDNDSDPIEGGLEVIYQSVFDTSGKEITKEDFTLRFGSQFLDSLSVYEMWKKEAGNDVSGVMFKYDELINRADVAAHFKEYSNAIEYYKKAVLLMPDKAYPKRRIHELENRWKKVK